MSTFDESKPYRTQTKLVRGGTNRSGFRETSEAIYVNSGYVYDSAEQAQAAFKGETDNFIYSRFANPTVRMFEERLAQLEGAESCYAAASGMAAIFAAMACQLQAGDHVVGSNALFGSCHYILANILPKWGVKVTFVDGTDLNQWEDALKEGANIVFFETPSNPTLRIIDVETVCKLAHDAGAIVLVDNVFASPVLQKPLELGADLVAYSTTKHIDGQGRCLGGAVLGSTEFIKDTLTPFVRNTGPCMSPFNAWVTLKGLETLDLRMERHCRNAQHLAEFLEGQNGVKKVAFPGLKSHPQYDLIQKQMSGPGGLIALELEGGADQAFNFLNGLELIDISNNLGDSKTLATHPTTTTHQRLEEEERLEQGITPGMVRISVGLEDVQDLQDDLSLGLSKL